MPDAEEGVESECGPVCSVGRFRVDLRSPFMLAYEFAGFLCESEYGLKRSRVNSNNSEPMASIADAYRSRRIRDSDTMNSANRRMRSSSLDAEASF